MNQTLNLAFYRIIKSMMHILYRKGIAFKAFSLIVKQAYIDVIEEELTKSGERVTTTRIAAITGLTRKDVARIRQQQPEEPTHHHANTEHTHIKNNTTKSEKTFDIQQDFSRSSRIINGWTKDADFCDNQQQAHVLPFRGDKSFEQLVQRYSGDMSAFAMLEEMKRIHMVSEDNGHITLLSPVYIPQGDEEAIANLLGIDVALLINTIGHNLSCQDAEQRYYQRKVIYNNLPQETLPEFKAFVKQDAQDLLLRFNSWLAAHDRDSNQSIQGEGRMQAGVGIYYFEQSAHQETASHEH